MRLRINGLPADNIDCIRSWEQRAHGLESMQVKARQLWGVDVYTHDSDLVAILMHCGYISSTASVPRDAVAEAQVLVEHLPRLLAYPSCHRNGVRSRAWGEYEGGFSIKVILHATCSSSLDYEPQESSETHATLISSKG